MVFQQFCFIMTYLHQDVRVKSFSLDEQRRHSTVKIVRENTSIFYNTSNVDCKAAMRL